MLKYVLVENGMTTEPYNCVAAVSSPEVKDLNDVIDFMIAEGSLYCRVAHNWGR